MFGIILEERKRREIDSTVAMLQNCFEQAGADGNTPEYTRERIGEMLTFMETVEAWYSQVRRLPLAARGGSPTGRVAGAVGADARRPDAGHTLASSRRGNTADGPAPPVTRRAPGVCARWLCFSSSRITKHRLPSRALPANADPWRATARDFHHGLREGQVSLLKLGRKLPKVLGAA